MVFSQFSSRIEEIPVYQLEIHFCDEERNQTDTPFFQNKTGNFCGLMSKWGGLI